MDLLSWFLISALVALFVFALMASFAFDDIVDSKIKAKSEERELRREALEIEKMKVENALKTTMLECNRFYEGK